MLHSCLNYTALYYVLYHLNKLDFDIFKPVSSYDKKFRLLDKQIKQNNRWSLLQNHQAHKLTQLIKTN